VCHFLTLNYFEIGYGDSLPDEASHLLSCVVASSTNSRFEKIFLYYRFDEEMMNGSNIREGDREFNIARYEDLSNEARHNQKIAWIIAPIFITTSFLFTGYLFTYSFKNSIDQFFLILVIFTLLWYQKFTNAAISKSNHRIYKLMAIIIGYYQREQFDYEGRKRNIWVSDFFIVIYNGILACYSYTIFSDRWIGLLTASMLLCADILLFKIIIKFQDIKDIPPD
jgi:hypothetical protein